MGTPVAQQTFFIRELLWTYGFKYVISENTVAFDWCDDPICIWQGVILLIPHCTVKLQQPRQTKTTAESLSTGFNYQRKYKSVQLNAVDVVSQSL